MKTPPQGVGFTMFDHESWHRHDIRVQMLSGGLKPLHSTSDNLCNLLATIPEHQAFFAVIAGLNRRGLHGYHWMIEQITTFRKLCPTLGVVFVTDSADPWREGCLPPMVWIVNSARFDLVAMQAEIDLQKNERCSQYRETGRSKQCGLITRRQRQNGNIGTIPNYNIKHPSILAPLALMSVQQQCEIYCEISPQEALTLYRAPYSPDTRTMVMHALQSVREAVSHVNDRTGSRLKLHLDHCDDLYLLEYAADNGFDSVMADGSARGLAQNIAFTQKAKSVLTPYEVSIEGEVGNIDGGGARRWNRTRVDDFKCYLKETGIDYVGVHIGQFHGFHYDYQCSREKHALIVAQRKHFGDDDWHAFLMACQQLDDECAALKMSRTSDERKLLADCAMMALDGTPQADANAIGVLRTISDKSPLRCQPLLAQLETNWLQFRLERLKFRNKLWSGIMDSEQKISHRKFARLDISLLDALSDIAQRSSSKLVVHGGSSISEDDLRQLRHYGVARVNFGTDVFQHYITQLASCYSLQASIQLRTAQGRQTFLDEYANNWKQWLDSPPEFVHAFSNRLINQHLKLMEPARFFSKSAFVE